MAVPGVRFRAVSPRPNYIDQGRVNRATRTALEKQCAPRLKSYFTRIVAPWDDAHRPDFAVEVKGEETTGYTITCQPTGANAQYWLWTSRGTRPHKIVPKNAPRLIFQLGYKPHTGIDGHYRGPGVATGPWVAAKSVNHPGTKARHFEESIARWYAPVFKRVMEKAIQDAITQGAK